MEDQEMRYKCKNAAEQVLQQPELQNTSEPTKKQTRAHQNLEITIQW